jgi:site-specific recombinase XerD
MEITVYKRHSNDCEHTADRAYRRCTCRMMLEWSDNGKRYRVSAKTRSWSEAEQRARAMMQDAHARRIGEQPKAADPVSLDSAIEMFTAKKNSKHKETRRKYQYTLNNLRAWAVRNGRHYLADLTESDLEKYQSSWTLNSNYAKRNEQERLRTFFRYCCASAEIKLPYNPTAQLEHFNVTSDEPEDPYTEKEHKAIVSAVDECGFKPEVANGNPKYIFWSGNGEPVTVAKDFSEKLKKVFDASGVKGAHSHRFRKTYGVDLLSHGAPLEMVSN